MRGWNWEAGMTKYWQTGGLEGLEGLEGLVATGGRACEAETDPELTAEPEPESEHEPRPCSSR